MRDMPILAINCQTPFVYGIPPVITSQRLDDGTIVGLHRVIKY